MAESMATRMLTGEPTTLDSMRIRTAVFRSLAPCLALLLVSCGSTLHTAFPRAEELSGFVLIIREDSDGQVSHSWRRATELDLPRYDPPSSQGSTVGRIVLASRRPRDCDQEQIDCVRACMKRRFPSSYSHITRGDGSKNQFCERECLNEYMGCLELQKSHALQFSAVNDAVEWLKRNREELLLGTVVIIAGVAFVTVSAGAGLTVLAPVVLVAG
jgi:hypothetical protein